jgi:hypothetical protein
LITSLLMARPDGIDRRRFFPSLAKAVERAVVDGEVPGMVRLDRLGILGDDRLADLRPQLQDDITVVGTAESLQVCRRGSDRALCAFPRDRFSSFVLGAFNGTQTLGDLSRIIAARYEWTESRAWDEVRRAFLVLAGVGAVSPERSKKA